MARGTLNPRFILSIQQIHHDTLITFQVILPGLKIVPRLCCHHLIRPKVGLHTIGLRFLMNSVQILVNAIQQKGKKLRTIMLRHALKLIYLQIRNTIGLRS